MVKPSRERVRKWREKKAEKGGRSLSTWLEPETAQMMDFLLDHYGESAAPLIARAVTTLYEVTRDGIASITSVASNAPEVVAEAAEEKNIALPDSVADAPSLEPLPALTAQAIEDAEAVVTIHPMLQQIKTKLSSGIPFKELQKNLLVQWIKSMQAEGVSFLEMTELLNSAGIPTPTGMGRWEAGMIPTVLLLSSF
jgi:hypothetical protein